MITVGRGGYTDQIALCTVVHLFLVRPKHHALLFGV